MSQVTVTHGFHTFKEKVTPSTLVNEVLIATCKHFKLDTNSYQLKYGKSNLDLSLPFRLLNLPFGAKIELIKSDNTANTVSSVVIKLQLSPPIEDKEFVSPDSKLLIDTFKSDRTMLELMKHFEEKTSTQIFGRELTTKNYSAGKKIVSTFNPIAQTISKVLETESDFNQKLSALGMNSGNHVVRVRFKKTDSVIDIPRSETLDPEEMDTAVESKDAPETSSSMEIDEPEEPKKIIENIDCQQSTSLKESTETEILDSTIEETAEEELEPIEEEEKAEEVQVEVFKATDEPVHIYEHDDSVYDLSVDQARLYQSLLSKQAHSGGMMTKRLRMEQELKYKKAKEQVSECNIRIRFPDQTFVQLKFKPTQTLGDLYKILVEKILNLSERQNSQIESGDREPVFQLLIPHPAEVILGTSEDFDKQLVAHCNFGSRSLLLYQEEDKIKRQYLTAEYLSSAKSLNETDEVKLEYSRGQLEGDSKTAAPTGSSPGESRKPAPLSSFDTSGAKPDGKKIPKWLKLNKK